MLRYTTNCKAKLLVVLLIYYFLKVEKSPNMTRKVYGSLPYTFLILQKYVFIYKKCLRRKTYPTKQNLRFIPPEKRFCTEKQDKMTQKPPFFWLREVAFCFVQLWLTVNDIYYFKQSYIFFAGIQYILTCVQYITFLCSSGGGNGLSVTR